jgi:hypothetical protein
VNTNKKLPSSTMDKEDEAEREALEEEEEEPEIEKVNG